MAIMQIQTSRFGDVSVDERRILSFPNGMLGFPDQTRYVLLEAGQATSFWWLQSIERAELAFVVTDPSLFVPSYRVPISQPQMQALGLGSIDEAQVFVIVNKREHLLTGNLQGPVVINVAQRLGEQLVLSDRRFTTRVPLMELPQPVQAQSA
jgi:flagellar assembly factor FliW